MSKTKMFVILFITTLLVIVAIVGAIHFYGNENEKSTDPTPKKLDEVTLKTPNDWEKVEIDKTPDPEHPEYVPDYTDDTYMKYTNGESTISVEVFKNASQEDLLYAEENIVSEYKGCKDKIIEVSGIEGVEYSFSDKKIVHVTTEEGLYIITYTNENNDFSGYKKALKWVIFERGLKW